MKKKIAVIGGGSWATAIVKMLCNNVETLHWWIRNPETVEHIKNFNIILITLRLLKLIQKKLFLVPPLKKLFRKPIFL